MADLSQIFGTRQMKIVPLGSRLSPKHQADAAWSLDRVNYIHRSFWVCESSFAPISYVFGSQKQAAP